MPAIDCFILKLLNNKTEEPSEELAKRPATLVYVFANIDNFTIGNLLMSNKINKSEVSVLNEHENQDTISEMVIQTYYSTNLFRREDSNQKISYDIMRRKILFTYICNFMMKEVAVDTQALHDKLMAMGKEFIFNNYIKTMAFLEVIEHIADPAEVRECFKRYFDMLISDLELEGIERPTDELHLDQDLKNQISCSISIKDVKWKLVLLGQRNNFAHGEIFVGLDPQENYLETMEVILSKNQFFDREELTVPLRFMIMGGSPDLQVMCQNFGSLFEVRKALYRQDQTSSIQNLFTFIYCPSKIHSLPIMSLS